MVERDAQLRRCCFSTSSLFDLPSAAFRLEKTFTPGLEVPMELWTEYEGRTIDRAFPLKKLLRPEGRSAFFSTSSGQGVPTVIRLIESHFDDEEILARWRGVAALNHPNVLKLEQFGHVVLDDTPVVYAVMEPVDANLSEVLSQQSLTLADTKQLAASLVAALGTLHTHGFVHEHVEPANVFAVGDVVKLRSDCIREAPEGAEGQELKRRDLYDLSVVLLQALTQERTLEAAAQSLPLPAPFDQIVRKGMNGEWGLAEIAAALEPGNGKRHVSPEARTPAVQSAPLPATPPPAPKKVEVAPVATRSRRPLEEDVRRARPKIEVTRTGWMLVVGLAVLLCLWLGWYLLHSRPAKQNSAPQATSTPPPAADNNATKATPPPAPVEKTNVPPPQTPTQTNNTAGPHAQWRVVAYTYNRENQAQHKAEAVARRHPDLHPEVFTPNGHAPYLVTVGGKMSRDEAFALARKVRSEGLPRDTYAQNYTDNGR